MSFCVGLIRSQDILRVQNMHIVFYPRVPTSEERKKERERERERERHFNICDNRLKGEIHKIPRYKKTLPVFFFQVKRSLCRINKTRFYTHARIEHTREIVLSTRSTGIVFGTSSSVFSSRLCGQPERVEVRYLKLEFKTLFFKEFSQKGETRGAFRCALSLRVSLN